jgi:hypothetical protein
MHSTKFEFDAEGSKAMPRTSVDSLAAGRWLPCPQAPYRRVVSVP